MKICGIYKITSPSNKIYIGSSVNISKRKISYRNLSCKSQPRLYNSLSKYGWEVHTFEILEECIPKYRFNLERTWGLFYNVLGKDTGLNCYLPATNDEPFLLTDESRYKRSEQNKGRKMSEENKQKLIDRLTGVPRSQETRQKISIGNLGKPKSKAHIAKLKLRTYTVEQCKLNSERQKGKKLTEETKKKISEANKGRVISNQHKKIISKLFSKEIIDIETNIIYPSLKEAAKSVNLNEDQLSTRLRGLVKNKTNLRYV